MSLEYQTYRCMCCVKNYSSFRSYSLQSIFKKRKLFRVKFSTIEVNRNANTDHYSQIVHVIVKVTKSCHIPYTYMYVQSMPKYLGVDSTPTFHNTTKDFKIIICENLRFVFSFPKAVGMTYVLSPFVKTSFLEHV